MDSLSGPNIGLRALEPEDIDLLYKWENDPSIWHLGDNHAPFSLYILSQYLQNSTLDIFETRQLRMVIQLNSNPNHSVGFIDLFEFDPLHRRAGIGILIGEQSDRKKGYAAEAAGLLLDYCFTVLLLHQIWCGVPASNKPSIQLFTKLGFVSSGIRKSWINTAKGFEDEVFFQLLVDDWKSKAS